VNAAHTQAARANLRWRVTWSFFCARAVRRLLSKGVSFLRKARFFFFLKSTGVYFFFLNYVLAASMRFSLSTVSTLATFFLTCLIIVSLTWGWDETFDTRSSASLFCTRQNTAS